MRPYKMSWPGGEHDFALPLGQLRALQINCDAGPEQILNRLSDSTWRVDDLIETLRLGLIGGGLTNEQAGPMVHALFQKTPIIEFVWPAKLVLANALVGPPDDMPGKDTGPATETATAPENGSSPPSTETGL